MTGYYQHQQHRRGSIPRLIFFLLPLVPLPIFRPTRGSIPPSLRISFCRGHSLIYLLRGVRFHSFGSFFPGLWLFLRESRGSNPPLRFFFTRPVWNSAKQGGFDTVPPILLASFRIAQGYFVHNVHVHLHRRPPGLKFWSIPLKTKNYKSSSRN